MQYTVELARIRLKLTALALAAAPALLTAATAHAHISVEGGGTHKARFSDDSLKDSPCGAAGGRGTNIYRYKPGATITLSILETISHPGYFRIAFDADGDDDFVIPSGTSGENGDCAGDAKCGMGKEDYCNNDSVLLDNLDPHERGEQKKYTWSVTLPNIECDNCTLQVIQMMNDLNFHFAPFPDDDIYYQCIDLVLSNDAPDVTDTPVMNNGMVCNAGSTAGGDGAAGAAGMGSEAMPAAGAGAEMMAAAGSGGMPMDMDMDMAMDMGSAQEPSMTASAGGASASTTTTTTSAMTAPTAGTGMSTSASSATTASQPSTTASTDTSAEASPEPSASDDGGCQAAHGGPIGLMGPTVLGLLGFALRRRRSQAARG